MGNIFSEPLTRKKTGLIVGLVAVLTLAIWGGPSIFQKILGRPPTPEQAQKLVWKFLSKETSQRDFKLASETAGSTNNASFETNALGQNVKLKGKAKKLALPETGYSKSFKEKQEAAASYKEIYRLIGQQLWVADEMFATSELIQKQSGLIMVTEASRYALNNAENAGLAARICEGFLWPHLDLVEGNDKGPLTADQLLNICDIAFKEAGETNNIIRNYKFLISKSSRPNRADMARFRLSIILQDQGEYPEALRYLREIQGTGKSAAVQQRIAFLEGKLKPTGR